MSPQTPNPTFTRRGTWAFLGALGVLAAALAGLWLLWGFRWPPTAEVVTQAEPEEERVELEEGIAESTRRDP